eukprot:Unigene2076_Nuclearia_a/m.6449 Unigene2076_Nuclearia_a/g.6449  ORF Unigene2076_Nuclearia_a/g.6449 Unigene2076_Nuclearia_a/m.6449 type:complete len:212 (+) Unigene2076_Nuclearia_a:247-882(+)
MARVAALVAFVCALAGVALAGVPSNTPATCTISNGILTLWNTPKNVQCVSRSDIPSSYIKSGGNIANRFVFGATVTPHSLQVTVTFYNKDDCTSPAGYITCTNLPDTRCVLDNQGKPVLLSVGPPALCAKRWDTQALIKFTTDMTPVRVPLGDAVPLDLCPIQVSLFKDAACTQYLDTQHLYCPCTQECIPDYNGDNGGNNGDNGDNGSDS